MCQEAEFTKFRNGIGYSASELKTIERCVSSRSSSDVVTDVQTWHNDVQSWHNDVQTWHNDVQTWHKSTTIVQTASEVARGPQISRSHTGAPAFCSTHWNQGNKSEHSQRSMFLKNIVKIWPKRGRVASGLQFAGRLPVQPPPPSISQEFTTHPDQFLRLEVMIMPLVEGNKSLAQLWGSVLTEL